MADNNKGAASGGKLQGPSSDTGSQQQQKDSNGGQQGGEKSSDKANSAKGDTKKSRFLDRFSGSRAAPLSRSGFRA